MVSRYDKFLNMFKDRRKIEQDAFAGHLLGIVATNALELGIDIGALDAVLMLGFPYTLSNFKQQAGRAGRRAKDSLAVLIAEPFPIDQYYIQHPTALFDSKLNDLSIDIENEVVREGGSFLSLPTAPLTTGESPPSMCCV